MANKHNNCRWLDRYMDCCRNTATHPNSWITPNGIAIFVEPKCQRCAGCGYEPITPDAPAWDDPAESEERWADEYFVRWEAAEAEVDRLRDLVRRLAESLECAAGALWLANITQRVAITQPESPRRHLHGVDIDALLREAREALGKEEP